MNLLEFKNVSVKYQTDDGETQAIKNVSFNVKDGEFVAIIGPSGCGKTTLLSLTAGLFKASQGEILFKGKKIVKPQNEIGYMLQRDELFEWRTILKNALLPLEIKKTLNEEKKKYVLSLLERYGLKEFINSYPNQISGGMRQRVALIRTLSSNPELLLLDEPFSALDYQTRLAVCDDIYKIIKSEKKTAVLVTHDISEALSMADRIVVLSKRPATVYKIHEYNFDRDLSPLLRRENKDFGENFKVLWSELNYDETRDKH